MTLPDPALVRWPRSAGPATLRLLESSDVDAMWSYRSLPEVCRHLSHEPMTREQVVERIAQRLPSTPATSDRVVRGIAVTVEGRMVGDAVFKVLREGHLLGSGPEILIGYALHPDVWGRGIGSALASALVEVAGELGLPVAAEARPANVASQRLLRNAGFTQLADAGSRGREQHLFGIRPAEDR